MYKLHLEKKKSPGNKLKLTNASPVDPKNVLSDFLFHYFLCTLTIMQYPASHVYASIMGDQSSLSKILRIPGKPLQG